MAERKNLILSLSKDARRRSHPADRCLP